MSQGVRGSPKPAIVRSLNSSQSVLERVAECYPIGLNAACRLFRVDKYCDMYLISENSRDYLARLYSADARSVEHIDYELKLFLHLHSQGLDAFKPLRDRDSRLASPCEAPEGTRYLAMFDYRDHRGWRWNVQEARRVGQRLAEVHLAGDSFDPEAWRPKLEIKDLLLESVETLMPCLANRPEDASYLKRFAEGLRCIAEEAIGSGCDWGPCPGLIARDIFRVDRNDAITLTGSGLSYDTWRVLHLASFHNEHLKEVTWDSFLSGYSERRALTAAERSLLPYFAEIYRLWRRAMIARMANWRGTVNSVGKRLSHDLSVFRHRETALFGSKLNERAPRPPVSGAASRRSPGREIREGGDRYSGPVKLNSEKWLTAIYCTSDAIDLIPLFESEFPIGKIGRCSLLCAGVNDTYLIQGLDLEYVTRVYRANWRTAHDIAYELHLLEYLASKNVSVSAPLRTKRGDLSISIDMPEGARHAALFTVARGEPMSWTSLDQIYAAGRTLAQIHAVSDDFRCAFTRFNLDLEYLIDGPLRNILPHLSDRPSDREYIEHFAHRLNSRLEQLIGAGLDWGPCHGDLGGANVHVTKDHHATFFDFDLGGPGWRAYDLGTIEWISTYMAEPKIWTSFMAGYEERRGLSDEDKAAIPLMHAAQHLWLLGFSASKLQEWGKSRITKGFLDRQLEFFWQWDVEHS